MRILTAVVCSLLSASDFAAADEQTQLRANIGKVACNATNGAYRGRIVDVGGYSAAGQASSLVYIVEREGRRSNAPVSNTTVVPDKCPDGQPAASTKSAGAAVASAPQVDPTLSGVAKEFSGRLMAVQGQLMELRSLPKTISVKWTSRRCDMVEGEVIDFLLSLNRAHPARVNQTIQADRICGGTTRRFTATAARFSDYRAGRINDAAILRGLK